jgi:hypothetical protein
MVLWTLLDISTTAGLIALCLVGLVHAIFLIALLEYNKRVFGTVLTIATLVAVIAFGNTKFFGWVMEHWGLALAYAGGYIVAGAITGVIKWFSYARHGAERWYNALIDWKKVLPNKIKNYQQQINEEMAWRAEWAQRNPGRDTGTRYLTDDEIEKMRQEIIAYDTVIKAKDLTPETKPYFVEYIAGLEKSTGKLYHIPDVDDQGSFSLFLSWSSFWPWVLVWTIINDPLRRIFAHIYYWIKGLLRSLAEYAWRDIHDKMSKLDKPTPPPVVENK